MSGNRYEKAKEKHLSDLDVSVIDQLAYFDPSGDLKYLDWKLFWEFAKNGVYYSKS